MIVLRYTGRVALTGEPRRMRRYDAHLCEQCASPVLGQGGVVVMSGYHGGLLVVRHRSTFSAGCDYGMGQCGPVVAEAVMRIDPRWSSEGLTYRPACGACLVKFGGEPHGLGSHGRPVAFLPSVRECPESGCDFMAGDPTALQAHGTVHYSPTAP